MPTQRLVQDKPAGGANSPVRCYYTIAEELETVENNSENMMEQYDFYVFFIH